MDLMVTVAWVAPWLLFSFSIPQTFEVLLQQISTVLFRMIRIFLTLQHSVHAPLRQKHPFPAIACGHSASALFRSLRVHTHRSCWSIFVSICLCALSKCVTSIAVSDSPISARFVARILVNHFFCSSDSLACVWFHLVSLRMSADGLKCLGRCASAHSFARWQLVLLRPIVIEVRLLSVSGRHDGGYLREPIVGRTVFYGVVFCAPITACEVIFPSDVLRGSLLIS